MKHKKIIALIKVVRESFHDSYLVYSYGGCYGFFQIIKHIFPEARPYFVDTDEDHILSKIEKRFYDIKGEYFPTKTDTLRALTHTEIEHWEGTANGQRLERMLAKYQRTTNRIAKEE